MKRLLLPLLAFAVATLPVVRAQDSSSLKDIPIVVHTDKGDIEATIFASKTPVTAANFLNLAQHKFYDGLTFHRVIPHFMIQGGDPQGTGTGGPGYSFEDESNGPRKFDKPGVFAMANAGANTNGSQFFITHQPVFHLNDGEGSGHYTIFGQTTKGQEVVNAITQGDKIKSIDILGPTAPLFESQAKNLTCGTAICPPPNRPRTKMNNDPSARRLLVFDDPAALARAAAEEVTRRITAAVRANGRAAVALSGGSTPKVLYGLLADEPSFRERLPWVQTHFFFGDERHVPPDDKDSNFRMANEAMFEKLAGTLPPENIHRVHGETPDAYAAAAAYAREIGDFFGDLAPRFDLTLLGMGPEGHTASLFPGTTGLRETAPVAAAYIEKLAAYRITFTPATLKNSAVLLLLVAGKDKAETLATVLEGPSEPDKFPVQGISASDGETLWLLDQAAAAKLADAPSGK